MKKDFDCVEMKRKGQEALHKLLEGKSEAEILAFWAEQSRILREDQARARPEHAPAKKIA